MPSPQHPSAAASVTTAPFGRPGPAAPVSPFWLGERLLKDGVITPEQFASAQAKFRENPRVGFAAVLEGLGLASAAKISQLVASAYGMENAELTVLTVDRDVARSFPEARARQKGIIPFRRIAGELHVATSDPGSYGAAHARGDFPGQTIKIFVAPQKDITAAIADAWAERSTSQDPQTLLENILKAAAAVRASDVHLEPLPTALRVRFRVDNRVIHDRFLEADKRESITQAAKLFGRMDISDRQRGQDGQGRLSIGARTFSFRVSCLPCVGGESVVLRLIDEDAGVRTFEDIGLFPSEIERIKRMIDLPNGVIYVTGPTGSGKTTLLYSCLNQLPANELKIITVEDPVETVFPAFTQVQVNEKQGVTFGNTLPFILRQDPDVLLVGETRDLATARITIQASLTGHLCFSTLHTNDAVGTVTRLTDLGIEPYLIAASVKGVIAQRLVRKLCKHCRVPNPMNDLLLAEHAQLLGAAGLESPPQFFSALTKEGGDDCCPHCRGLGYRGRLAIIEVFPLDGVERMIAERRHENEIRQALQAMGYRNLRSDGILKASLGLTTVEEVLKVV